MNFRLSETVISVLVSKLKTQIKELALFTGTEQILDYR